MTRAEITKQYKADPKLLIAFLVQNNPKQIYANLREVGVITSQDPNEMYTRILELSTKRPKCFQRVINIPLRYTEDHREIVDAFVEAGVFNPIKTRSTVKTTDNTNTDYFDDWVDRPDNPSDFLNNNDDTEVSGNWNWDWLGNAFGAIGSAFNFLSGSNNNQPSQDNSNSGNKTGMIVIGSIVLIAIGVGIYFITKK